MKEKRQGSLLRLGLAAALACGMTPAAAFAEPVRGAARWLKEGLLASWHGTGAVYKGARHEWEAWREDRSYDDADRRRPGGPS